MPKIPEQNYSKTWPNDSRLALPVVADERTVLSEYLDWHRATFELKCAGLSADQLSDKCLPPSGLSLHGLARHLAGVERWWFRSQFAGEDVAMLYYSDEDPDQDFEHLDGDVGQAFDTWRSECARSRDLVAAASSLDQTGVIHADDRAISLRVILVKMIAEYARHNGHADLLRERLDGMTGS